MQTLTYSVPGISCGHCRVGDHRRGHPGSPASPPSTSTSTRKVVTVTGAGVDDAAVRDCDRRSRLRRRLDHDHHRHPHERIELPITGMTCASCANRIERRLNKLDGVTATVNYATETATVEYDAERVAPDQLVDAVEAAGYQAALRPPTSSRPRRPARPRSDATAPACGGGSIFSAARRRCRCWRCR